MGRIGGELKGLLAGISISLKDLVKVNGSDIT